MRASLLREGKDAFNGRNERSRPKKIGICFKTHFLGDEISFLFSRRE